MNLIRGGKYNWKNQYGATHFLPMKDGVTPGLYYKKIPISYNDNTCINVWHYLLFANIWLRSSNSEEDNNKILIPIKKE